MSARCRSKRDGRQCALSARHGHEHRDHVDQGKARLFWLSGQLPEVTEESLREAFALADRFAALLGPQPPIMTPVMVAPDFDEQVSRLQWRRGHRS